SYCVSTSGFKDIFPFKVEWIEDCKYMDAQDKIIDFRYKLAPLVWCRHKARVVEYEHNHKFVDRLEQGRLYKFFEHRHYFAQDENDVAKTVITDEIEFSLGFGNLVDKTIGIKTLDNTFCKRHKNIIAYFDKQA
ncbi:MAG: hypothetical protein RLZZ210_393, partial [Pseudomonadota bacterium]